MKTIFPASGIKSPRESQPDELILLRPAGWLTRTKSKGNLKESRAFRPASRLIGLSVPGILKDMAPLCTMLSIIHFQHLVVYLSIYFHFALFTFRFAIHYSMPTVYFPLWVSIYFHFALHCPRLELARRFAVTYHFASTFNSAMPLSFLLSTVHFANYFPLPIVTFHVPLYGIPTLPFACSSTFN